MSNDYIDGHQVEMAPLAAQPAASDSNEGVRGRLLGEKVDVIKSGRWTMAPTTKKVLVALAVLVTAAAVFTGIGAAALGGAAIAVGIAKASMILAGVLGVTALAVAVVGSMVIKHVQEKQATEHAAAKSDELLEQKEVLGKRETKCIDQLKTKVTSEAKGELKQIRLDLAEIRREQEVLFQRQLSKDPAARAVFERLQNLVGINNFSIPIDQRVALLKVLNLKVTEGGESFDGAQAVNNYLMAAETAPQRNKDALENNARHPQQSSVNDAYVDHFQMAIATIEERFGKKIAGDFVLLNVLLMAATGDAANSQMYTDTIRKGVLNAKEMRERIDGKEVDSLMKGLSDKTLSRYLSSEKTREILASSVTGTEQRLAQLGYQFEPTYGVSVRSSWDQETPGMLDADYPFCMKWEGSFVFERSEGGLLERSLNATLDLRALGSLTKSQKVAAMTLAEVWSAGEYKSDGVRTQFKWVNEGLPPLKEGDVPPPEQRKFLPPPYNSGNFSKLTEQDKENIREAYQHLTKPSVALIPEEGRQLLGAPYNAMSREELTQLPDAEQKRILAKWETFVNTLEAFSDRIDPFLRGLYMDDDSLKKICPDVKSQVLDLK